MLQGKSPGPRSTYIPGLCSAPPSDPIPVGSDSTHKYCEKIRVECEGPHGMQTHANCMAAPTWSLRSPRRGEAVSADAIYFVNFIESPLRREAKGPPSALLGGHVPRDKPKRVYLLQELSYLDLNFIPSALGAVIRQRSGCGTLYLCVRPRL